MQSKNEIQDVIKNSKNLTSEEKEMFLEQLQFEEEPFSNDFLELIEDLLMVEVEYLAKQEQEVNEKIEKAEKQEQEAKKESEPKKQKLSQEYTQALEKEIFHFENQMKKSAVELDAKKETIEQDEEKSQIDAIRNTLKG